jgi:hypothetical protein
VKRIYAPQGCGLSVKIKNAGGKGAKHVVDWTIRQTQIAEFDDVAALLDTDVDWSEAVHRKAKKARIIVLQSTPQFEAMLLRLIGINDDGDSPTLKRKLAPFVNNNALHAGNYSTHFGRECLDRARNVEPTIQELLKLFP